MNKLPLLPLLLLASAAQAARLAPVRVNVSAPNAGVAPVAAAAASSRLSAASSLSSLNAAPAAASIGAAAQAAEAAPAAPAAAAAAEVQALSAGVSQALEQAGDLTKGSPLEARGAAQTVAELVTRERPIRASAALEQPSARAMGETRAALAPSRRTGKVLGLAGIAAMIPGVALAAPAAGITAAVLAPALSLGMAAGAAAGLALAVIIGLNRSQSALQWLGLAASYSGVLSVIGALSAATLALPFAVSFPALLGLVFGAGTASVVGLANLNDKSADGPYVWLGKLAALTSVFGAFGAVSAAALGLGLAPAALGAAAAAIVAAVMGIANYNHGDGDVWTWLRTAATYVATFGGAGALLGALGGVSGTLALNAMIGTGVGALIIGVMGLAALQGNPYTAGDWLKKAVVFAGVFGAAGVALGQVFAVGLVPGVVALIGAAAALGLGVLIAGNSEQSAFPWLRKVLALAASFATVAGVGAAGAVLSLEMALPALVGLALGSGLSALIGLRNADKGEHDGVYRWLGKFGAYVGTFGALGLALSALNAFLPAAALPAAIGVAAAGVLSMIIGLVNYNTGKMDGAYPWLGKAAAFMGSFGAIGALYGVLSGAFPALALPVLGGGALGLALIAAIGLKNAPEFGAYRWLALASAFIGAFGGAAALIGGLALL